MASKMMRDWHIPFRVWVAGIAILGLPVDSSAQPSLETAIKATYLYKFVPFVSWPNGAQQAGTINICIVGKDPFGQDIDRAVAGQSVDGRSFRVVRIRSIGPQSACDIAYLGGSSEQPISAALLSIHGAPILSVTDVGAPAGIVAFEMQSGRVRFQIDQDAANAGHLRISSKLLSLATRVKASGTLVQP